jgi:hypothetical protein
MRAIANGPRPKPVKCGFWRTVAERLDALTAYPARHAVSEQELRRVDADIKRCRQLMFRKRQKRDMKLVHVAAADGAGIRSK